MLGTVIDVRQKDEEYLLSAYREIDADPRLRIVGSPAADVLLIKGILGEKESAGAEPFSGEDGVALSAALASLGWEAGEWTGVLTGSEVDFSTDIPAGADPHDTSALPEALRLVIEENDPLLVIALDAEALKLLSQAFFELSNAGLKNWRPGKAVLINGRYFLAVSGFEASLQCEEDKQRVWAELKAGAKAGLTKATSCTV